MTVCGIQHLAIIKKKEKLMKETKEEEEEFFETEKFIQRLFFAS